ncbi:hypothetical protein EA462_14250 [Natrarchaeobius halalkaliphilus]|uniref:DUF6760 domain-containing protein n=1 Tax=Natrarchaeobius halalkaliphilus TaxID=1679091 RepID=A0A3N6M0L5_9EURY|nr:hypothetical protein EA462_14250 [Natrarchaeobius halalkaliphilus]
MDPYPTERLYEEIAFVAYYFNWSRQEILELPHWERQRWCRNISQINEQKNEAGGSDTSLDPDHRVDDLPVANLEEMI